MTRASIGLALVVLTLLVYAQVRHFPFVNFDDAQYVSGNAPVAAGLTVDGIRWAFSSSHAGNWHPLTWISHMIDVEVYALSPRQHHLTSLILHIASAVLLFVVFLRMTQEPWPSAFVATMFAVHPTHVESVAWIAERKDVLSGFFWILTMGAYVRYTSAPSPARYAVVAGAFAAGLLAKPMVVTLPFVLLLLDVWPLNRIPRVGWRRLIVEKVPLIVLSAVSSIITFVVQREAGAVRTLDVLPYSRRIAAATTGYAEYVVKTVWPVDLAVLYPHPQTIPSWQVVGSVLLLAAITVAAAWWWRSRPYIAVGWFWFLGTLVPVIGLVQVGSQRIADRYLYLPSIGLFVVVAWGALEVARRTRTARLVLATAALAVIVPASVLAHRQVTHWRSSVALWEQTLRVTEGNSRAHAHLGHALAAEGRHDEAVAHYRRALEIRPDYPEALNYLGAALAQRGETASAIPMFRRALELSPRLPHARVNLGTALAQSGRLEESIVEYREALRADPGDVGARGGLGRVLMETGRGQEGAEYLLQVTAILLADGRLYEALEHLQVVLRDNPTHPTARPLLEELAARARSSRSTGGRR